MSVFTNFAKGLFGGDPMAPAREAADENFRRAWAEQEAALRSITGGTAASRATMDAALSNARAAYARSEAAVSAASAESRAALAGRGSEAQRSARASADRRGVGGGGVGESLARGERKSTLDQMATMRDLDAMAFGQIGLRQAETENRVLAAAAALDMQGSAARAALANRGAAMQAGRTVFPDYQAMAGQQLVSNLIGQAGSVAGMYALRGFMDNDTQQPQARRGQRSFAGNDGFLAGLSRFFGGGA